MAVATWQDVEVALGRPITDTAEQSRVEWWLNGAEIQIKGRLGNVALLDQDALRYVEAEAVAAKMTNPEGYASETVDDYTYRLPAETRRVTIIDEWWTLLAPKRGSFYTIPVTSPADIVP